jgi:hypothetical protein
MPSKTRLELRTLVRTQVQMEQDELPDGLLDMYLNDALDQTLALEERWPFLESEWNLTSVQGTIAYARDTTIGSVSAILDVTDSVFVLDHISHHDAELEFGQGSGGNSPSRYWSEWAGDIYLWDTPTVRSYKIRGFRRSAWGAADSAVVDCDDRLHVPIMWYAVALAYASQEDNEIEGVYMNRWSNAVARAQSQIMGLPTRRPLILSKGHRVRSLRPVLDL